MKKLYDLKAQRTELLYKLDKLTQRDTLSAEEKRDFDLNSDRIESLSDEIVELEKVEKQNKKLAGSFRTDEGISEESLREYFETSIKGGNQPPLKLSFRSEPLLSTSNPDIINKKVMPVDNLFSLSEELLKSLGVKFYTNLDSTLVLPVFDEIIASIADENMDASSADLSPISTTLSPHRISCYQSLSRELLSSSNPDLYTSVVKNLTEGLWNRVSVEFFKNISIDASTQKSTFGGGSLSLKELTLMEASLGSYTSLNPKYIMGPSTKAFLKNTEKPTGHLLWENDIVNSLPAFSSNSVEEGQVILGSFDKSVIGIWNSGIDLVIDPFTQAKKGLIIITAILLADSCVQNKKGFSILTDASIG